MFKVRPEAVCLFAQYIVNVPIIQIGSFLFIPTLKIIKKSFKLIFKFGLKLERPNEY